MREMSLFKVENDILQSMRIHFRLDEYDTSVRLHGGGFLASFVISGRRCRMEMRLERTERCVTAKLYPGIHCFPQARPMVSEYILKVTELFPKATLCLSEEGEIYAKTMQRYRFEPIPLAIFVEMKEDLRQLISEFAGPLEKLASLHLLALEEIDPVHVHMAATEEDDDELAARLESELSELIHEEENAADGDEDEGGKEDDDDDFTVYFQKKIPEFFRKEENMTGCREDEDESGAHDDDGDTGGNGALFGSAGSGKSNETDGEAEKTELSFQAEEPSDSTGGLPAAERASLFLRNQRLRRQRTPMLFNMQHILEMSMHQSSEPSGLLKQLLELGDREAAACKSNTDAGKTPDGDSETEPPENGTGQDSEE